MAIQTVDSSGKTVLALLGIQNQIQNGDTTQARSSAAQLRNELYKMQLTAQNKELADKTRKLDQALGDLQTSQEKVRSLTIDAELDAIGDKVNEKYHTDRYANQKELYKTLNANNPENRRLDAQDKVYDNLKKKVIAGIATPHEKELYKAMEVKRSGVDPVEFGDNQFLEGEIKKLENNTNRSASQNAELFILRAARGNYLDNLTAETIADYIRELKSEAGLKYIEDRINHWKQVLSNAPSADLKALRTEAEAAGGIREENINESVPAAGLPSQVFSPDGIPLSRSEAYRGMLSDIDTQRDIQKESWHPGWYQQQTDAAQAESKSKQEYFDSLSDPLKAMEYARRNFVQSGSDADREILRTFTQQALMSSYTNKSEIIAAMNFADHMIRDMQQVLTSPTATEQQKKDAQDSIKFYQQFRQQVAAKGLPEPEKVGTGGRGRTSTTPGQDADAMVAEMNKLPGDLESWTEKTAGDIEGKGNWATYTNTHPIISSFSADPVYRRHVGLWFDKDGMFSWTEPKDAEKRRAYAVGWFQQFERWMTQNDHTPATALEILKHLDKLSGDSPHPSQAVKEGEYSDAQLAVITYRGLKKDGGGKKVLEAFRKHLENLAGTAPAKRNAMNNPDATRTEWFPVIWRSEEDWAAQFRAAPTQQGGTPSQQPGVAPTDPSKNTKLTPHQKIQTKQTYRHWNREKRLWEDVVVDNVVRNAKGKITHIISEGHRIKLDGRDVYYKMDRMIQIRPDNVSFNIPSMTELVVVNKQFPKGKKLRIVKSKPSMSYVHATYVDEAGNEYKVPIETKFYFPKGTSTLNINRTLRGLKHTVPLTGRTTPSKEGQKKNKETPPKQPPKPAPKGTQPGAGELKGSTAATTSWQMIKSGGKKVLIRGSDGSAMASMLNERAPGEKASGGKKKGGFYDVDTAMNVSVQLPDVDGDGKPDEMLTLEDGSRVPLPDVWKSEKYTKGKGAVYTDGTNIRLAGFWAEEIELEDPKTGKRGLNPVAVDAQKAIVKMFQQGWVDPTDTRRFIFRVRVLGTPNQHARRASINKKYANPYADRYNRIVTDIYVAIGDTNVKIGEITWVNPVKELAKQGHGEDRPSR